MNVYLIDGTYELFRYHYGQPSRRAADGREVAATRGVLTSMVSMLESGCRYVGVATDHVVESFRNDLYAGYKTGEGIDAELFAQFPLLEDVLRSLGLTVWPMVEYEADDGLASAAVLAQRDQSVEQVVICSPDKDLAQCVVSDRVIQRNRRTETDANEEGIWSQYGVAPCSIPDWLALVGDSADGFPGLKGWGKKSASTVLAYYERLESIPSSIDAWNAEVRGQVRGAQTLCERLHREMSQALLFRDIATLRTDFPAFSNIEDLRWNGPLIDFEDVCIYLGLPRLSERIARLGLTA